MCHLFPTLLIARFSVNSLNVLYVFTQIFNQIFNSFLLPYNYFQFFLCLLSVQPKQLKWYCTAERVCSFIFSTETPSKYMAL